jgi:hypothetical protein
VISEGTLVYNAALKRSSTSRGGVQEKTAAYQGRKSHMAEKIAQRVLLQNQLRRRGGALRLFIGSINEILYQLVHAFVTVWLIFAIHRRCAVITG